MISLRKVIVAAFILSMVVTFVISSFNPASFSSALVLQTTKPPIPEPYYTTPRNPDLTYEDLERVVFNASMPHEYERDVFDCTEGAAWMEYYLENKGVDTVIATLDDHAYVIVRLGNGCYPINTFPIHFYHSTYYYVPTYLKPDEVFEDIYEACEQGWYSEWDWWTEVSVQ